MRVYSILTALLCVALLHFPASAATRVAAMPGSGQPVSANSVIRGVVTDEFQKAVPDAAVQLQSPDGVRNTTSDAKGQFYFGGLGVGSYFVQVSKAGYASQQSTTIYITEVATIDVNVSLQKNAATTLGRITVSASRGVQTSPVIY
ncbi:MAG: carboxypeptidase-like regulatory domain-containing protein, partial [Candidatus Eremiobacteraeota bacterium]|nr:carboxypeptidase-like regulatory domain-containing protein [Candidatus Eremiobacteraeota bacterium]